MGKLDIINYWLETSQKDYNTMLNLYESKDYHWCLFIGHLVIEKLLKAIYVKNIAEMVPRTHDLLRLAEKSNLVMSEEQKDMLDLVTTFNINARYPDYKQSFYAKCNYTFTTSMVNKIKELRIWLLSKI